MPEFAARASEMALRFHTQSRKGCDSMRIANRLSSGRAALAMKCGRRMKTGLTKAVSRAVSHRETSGTPDADRSRANLRSEPRCVRCFPDSPGAGGARIAATRSTPLMRLYSVLASAGRCGFIGVAGNPIRDHDTGADSVRSGGRGMLPGSSPAFLRGNLLSFHPCASVCVTDRNHTLR
jgi:hypothetical protein